jgi:hypothetical protein
MTGWTAVAVGYGVALIVWGGLMWTVLRRRRP